MENGKEDNEAITPDSVANGSTLKGSRERTKFERNQRIWKRKEENSTSEMGIGKAGNGDGRPAAEGGEALWAQRVLHNGKIIWNVIK